MALGLADKIAIVTVVKNVVPMIEHHVSGAHLDGRIVDVSYVSMPVMELTDHDRLVDALVEKSIRKIEEKHAQAIVLGCTAMIEVAERVKEQLLAKGYDVPVLEAAQTALMLLELQVKMGLTHSRETYGKHK